jgi:phosphatidylserine decarboxylase
MGDSQAARQEVRQAADLVKLWAFRALPRKLFSEAVRLAGRLWVPPPLRRGAYGLFASIYGADPSEAERELPAYGCLNDFFTRRLRADARQAPADDRVALSPADSLVTQVGEADQGTLVQAKGLSYTIDELFGSRELAQPFLQGSYITLYLRPRDYHRVHSPVSGIINEVWHIPGDRFPVVPVAVRRIGSLYSKNERVVIFIDTEKRGRVAVVMVAALGVGNITLSWHGGSVRATSPSGGGTRLSELEGRSVLAGGELGAFNLGSTVIVVFEPGIFRFRDLQPGEGVRVGQPIADPGRVKGER